jgi:hypothetical protein
MGAAGPFDYIAMGGMFTTLKVRENLTSYEDPGWYKHPAGTVAVAATEDELKRDGISVPTEEKKEAAASPTEKDPWCGTKPAPNNLLARIDLKIEN